MPSAISGASTRSWPTSMTDCPRLRAQIEAFCPYNEQETADRLNTKQDLLDRMTHSLSFGLLMTCLGLCVVLTVVICHVF